jgi:hypothetical protein
MAELVPRFVGVGVKHQSRKRLSRGQSDVLSPAYVLSLTESGLMQHLSREIWSQLSVSQMRNDVLCAEMANAFAVGCLRS